jgi:hypothetical protein
VVRAGVPWLAGRRVKANSTLPASSRLSATARQHRRDRRRNVLRFAPIACAGRSVDHVRVVG